MSMAQIQLLQRSSLSVNNQQKAPRPFKSRGFYYCKVIRYIIFIHPIRTGTAQRRNGDTLRKPPHWRSGRAAGEADGVPAGAAKACPAHTKKGAPTSYDVGAPRSTAATYSPNWCVSTIGARGLNCSVRYGKRWDPAAKATANIT